MKSKKMLPALLAVLCLGLSPSLTASPVTTQQRVMAMFLYNFANFVEWPKSAFASPAAPIKMCLYGDLPFSRFLQTVDGTLIGQRRLQVQQTVELTDIKEGCHVLYVASDRRAELPDFFKRLEFLYILSVGEQDEFADKGGVINIVRTSDQLTFDINLSVAIDRGLLISSDLLALARRIKQASGEGR